MIPNFLQYVELRLLENELGPASGDSLQDRRRAMLGKIDKALGREEPAAPAEDPIAKARATIERIKARMGQATAGGAVPPRSTESPAPVPPAAAPARKVGAMPAMSQPKAEVPVSPETTGLTSAKYLGMKPPEEFHADQGFGGLGTEVMGGKISPNEERQLVDWGRQNGRRPQDHPSVLHISAMKQVRPEFVANYKYLWSKKPEPNGTFYYTKNWNGSV